MSTETKLILDDGKDFRGTFDFGYEAGWHWSKNRGSYWTTRDFFWSHWEVKNGNISQVRWHVESPSATNDATLNQIKQAMIADFLTPLFQNIIEKNGLGFTKGMRTNSHFIECNRCTEPFRIELPPAQNRGTSRDNIEAVNKLMREAINDVLSRYKSRLEKHFSL